MKCQIVPRSESYTHNNYGIDSKKIQNYLFHVGLSYSVTRNFIICIGILKVSKIFDGYDSDDYFMAKS